MATRRLILFTTIAMTTHAHPSLPSRSSDACSTLSCPKDATCIPLAGDTTVLCCPEGIDCDLIRPIVCDISQQDPAKHADAPIKTTVFDAEMEKCGGSCCPFGYSCSDQDGTTQCVKDQDQSQRPKGSSTSTSSSATLQPSATDSTPSSTSSSAPTQTSAAAEEDSSLSGTPKPKLTSIIGGVVGGCLVLLIIAVIALLYIRRRRRRNNNQHGTAFPNNGFHEKSASFRSHTRADSSSSARHLNISEPIVQAESYRTDFILKSPSAASSISNRPPRQQQQSSRTTNRLSIPNPFLSEKSPTAASQASFTSHDERTAKTGVVGAARLPPIRSLTSSKKRFSRRTSAQQHQHQHQHQQHHSEGENIDVFADPQTVGNGGVDDHRITTFSDMMAQADLTGVHKGEQRYVPGTTPRI